MLIINNLELSLDTDFSCLIPIVAKVLREPQTEILSAELYRRSVDARRKSDIKFCCSVIVTAKNEGRILKRNKNAQKFVKPHYTWPKAERAPRNRPVIAGFGPAGMFAALSLSRAGLRPIVLERGRAVDERTADVAAFFEGGRLDTESNVQFGEGGAGTFSDGKLNTGIKDPRCRTVLEQFVKFGADRRILTDAKPHIGTDVLVEVVKNLRNEVIALGGEVRFSSRLEGIKQRDGRLCGILVNGEWIECDTLLLATGHSARDTFAMLKSEGIEMIRKPFSMGVRIEHLQSDINRALYGDAASHPALAAADYKLAVHLENGRGVYTFCMCPGGEVINASSEEGGIAVNGMSRSARDGVNANSAVLVSVAPEDIEGDDVLAGCTLQKQIERAAFSAAGGLVPVTTVGEFLYGEPDSTGKVVPTVKPRAVNVPFEDIFPDFIVDSLREALPLFDRKLCGFADRAAVLTAPETRSSSPVRIVRAEDKQSVSLKGLYPCGEGAGYAGGIMSAASDGLATAECIVAEIIQGNNL